MDRSEHGLSLRDLIEISGLLHETLLSKVLSPFALLGASLTQWMEMLLTELGVPGEGGDSTNQGLPTGVVVRGRVFIDPSARIEPAALIQGPTYIGPGAEVRHGAYIRGSVYVGRGAVVGHVTEVKGSVFLDQAKAAHLAYVGDSILGRGTNLGAGTKIANLKFDHSEVRYEDPHSKKLTGSGLKKFGALLGDGAQTGCNAVLNPGTILMPRTAVMGGVSYRGTLRQGVARK